MNKLFKLSKEASPRLVSLLDSVTLGTNGARYKHLDTKEKIAEADYPLHMYLERNENVMANITFCRRKNHWYLRYFAFASQFQTKQKSKRKSEKKGGLRSDIKSFMNDVLSNGYEGHDVKSLYAYVDPKNIRSIEFSESLGFKSVGQVATQTYSRAKPKVSSRVQCTDNWSEVKDIVSSAYGEHAYYFTEQTMKGPHYVLKGKQGQILAYARINYANWAIERLPGKYGGLLTRLIPWIPVLRKMIKPENHSFLVPEGVYVKNNDPKLIDELFESILGLNKKHLIIWWVFDKEGIYLSCKNRVSWGLVNKLIGVTKGEVVVKTMDESPKKLDSHYVSGYDFI